MPECPNCTDGTEMVEMASGSSICPDCGYSEDAAWPKSWGPLPTGGR